MNIETYMVSENNPTWKAILDLAERIPPNAWMLIGGAMVEIYTAEAGLEARETHDLDVLIDVMPSPSNARTVVTALSDIGYALREPGLKGAAFHRMELNDMVADLLVADHLPKHCIPRIKINNWDLLATDGGAQALQRATKVIVSSEQRSTELRIPDNLGAVILKCAAFKADRSLGRNKHLIDAVKLASLLDANLAINNLRGSDQKRIRAALEALNSAEIAWQIIPMVGLDTYNAGISNLQKLATAKQIDIENRRSFKERTEACKSIPSGQINKPSRNQSKDERGL